MTVKELFMSVSFDELLPFLKDFEEDHLDNIYAFREAYDILRNMEPNTDYQGEVIISCNTKVNHQIINIRHLDDDVWENELAKEINFKGDSKPDMREVAMRCLWELTFYGFSPSQRISTFDKISNLDIYSSRRFINVENVSLSDFYPEKKMTHSLFICLIHAF